MKSFIKPFICTLAVFLVCSSVSPLCQAQERTYPGIIALNDNRAYLGIQMDDVTANNMSKYKLNSERGVIVQSVAKGSPAEKADLKENDVILEFGGIQVWSSLQFSRLVRETPVGRKVDIVVSRDGSRVNLTAQVGERETTRAEGRMKELFPEDFWERGNRAFSFRVPNPPDERMPNRTTGKPRLGLTLQPLTDQLSEFLGVPGKKGAMVVSVASGSPSAGKVRAGDVIIGADDEVIDDPADLAAYVNSRAGASLKLKVIRDKKEIAVTVDLPGKEGDRGFKL